MPPKIPLAWVTELSDDPLLEAIKDGIFRVLTGYDELLPRVGLSYIVGQPTHSLASSSYDPTAKTAIAQCGRNFGSGS